MKKNIFMRIKLSKKGKYISALAVSLLICVAIFGCTPNRVSILTRQQTGTPIKASDVKIVSSFKDISEPWRVEGMISAYTLPIISNTAEKRVAVIKKTVADLGINTVIGLQYDIKIGSWNERTGPGRSNGILASIGRAQQQNIEALPKFIVCLPAVRFKIEKNQSTSLLDEYLREHIQYSLGYQRGYYVYKCDAPGVDNISILQGSARLEALSEPLGIQPDYALLCDVEGYDERGNIVVSRSITLRLTMTLYDLKEKKAVWTSTTEGISSKSVLGSFLVGGLPSLFGSDEFLTVSDALMKAVESMPTVKGFRAGPVSRY